jgi:hypothetical protein
LLDKFAVDEQLNFDAAARASLVDSPTGYRFGIRAIQSTAETGVGYRKVKTDSNRSDQKRFHNGLAY